MFERNNIAIQTKINAVREEETKRRDIYKQEREIYFALPPASFYSLDITVDAIPVDYFSMYLSLLG